jgi:hypothetical protein
MSLRGVIGLSFVACACTSRADLPADTGAALGASPLPCDVAKVLQDKCWSCHGATLSYTAPMHLTTWEATHAATREDPATPVFTRMGQRIHDPANPMPPPTWPTRLTAGETAVLDRWIAAGAPRGDGSSAGCESAPPPGSGGGSGVGGGRGVVGGSGGGGGGVAGVGGAGTVSSDAGALVPDPVHMPVAPDPGECTTLAVHARGNASGAPFTVPSGEQYYCFSFHLPLTGPTQALAFSPHHDSTTVIHHWLLYKMITPQIDGLVLPCVGFHADGALLAGWTPGAGDWNLPKDVGVNLGGGDFILEVHYNNTGAPVPDTSGVDICSTTALRPKTAGIFWLGTANIDIPAASPGTDIASNCRPNLTSDFHILRAWPHMHRLGRRMHAEVHHPNGTVDPLFDRPFDFNAQTQLDDPYVLKPGDFISTTCGYQNDTTSSVGFGERTQDEMCFNFTVGYPDTADLPGGLTPSACDN